MNEDEFELVVLGAGIAGLNALVAATSYLGRSDRVLLVDRRPRVGGMWVDTYDHVRLHQPYRLFTAGNVKWTLREERGHLATKPEVLDHLQHCLDVVAGRVDLETRFGWNHVSQEEVDGKVVVTLTTPTGATRTVRAVRLIKAFGFDVETSEPLELSSAQVQSVTPNDLDLVAASDTPVWVIGGGKTGLDAAQAILRHDPDREVNMLVGRGSIALRRDVLLASGADRWFRGIPFPTLSRELANRYDGTNEDEVRDWYYSVVGTGPTKERCEFAHGFGGVTSDAEMAEIDAGLNRAENEYLADVVDGEHGPEVVYRSGRRVPVPVGTWIVNCTGLLLRGSHDHELFASPSGQTLSIQLRSSVIPLTIQAGHFLTHLMFTDGLTKLPLYAVDAEALRDRMGRSPTPVVFPLTAYNLSLAFDHLPKKVFGQFGSDLLLWYPLPRRVAAIAQFARHHRSEREHHRRTLDTIRERYGVRCGPLDHVA